MPDFTYSDALKEALASCDNRVVILETLEFSHPALAEPLRLVKSLDGESLTLGLENGGGDALFIPCGFTVGKPQSGENGTQELAIGIPNVSRDISDFIELCISEENPVSVIFRYYLSDDLTQPQNGSGIRLFLYDVNVTEKQVTGRATFSEIINRAWPGLLEVYSKIKFGALNT